MNYKDGNSDLNQNENRRGIVKVPQGEPAVRHDVHSLRQAYVKESGKHSQHGQDATVYHPLDSLTKS